MLRVASADREVAARTSCAKIVSDKRPIVIFGNLSTARWHSLHMRPFFGGGRGAWVPNQSTTTSAGVTALVPGLTSLTDHELVSRAKRGDNQAIEALMRRYNRRLFRMARSILRNHAAARRSLHNIADLTPARLKKLVPNLSEA